MRTPVRSKATPAKARSGRPLAKAAAPRSTTIKISELARRLDTTPRALRYYETIGLLAPARTRGGSRLYSEVTLDRARRIVTLRRLGRTCPEVAVCMGLDLHSGADRLQLRTRLECLLARSLRDCQDLKVAVSWLQR